jgi:hypothetical protein
MDSVSYQVVFDISHRGPQYWWLLGIPLIMVTVGVSALRRPVGSPFRNRIVTGNRTFLLVYTGFAATVGIAAALSMATQYFALRSALAHGQYKVVEGVVTGFVPASGGDHHPEQFTVVTATGREEYSYSWAGVTQGFNESRPHGGPMRDSLRVRIADVHGVIARLEIAR